MFGCIGRLVVAVLLLILGAIGWHFRDRWMPKVKAFITTETGVRITRLTAPTTDGAVRYLVFRTSAL